MLHPLALALCQRFALGGIWVIYLMTLALAMSFLGYRWVERPGIEMGRRLARYLSTDRASENQKIILGSQ